MLFSKSGASVKKTAVARPKRSSSKQPNTVSVVQAREQFGDIVNRAALLSERVYVTRHGKLVAAVVSVADAELLEALEQRVDLAAVKAARADIARHGTIPLEKLARELGL